MLAAVIRALLLLSSSSFFEHEHAAKSPQSGSPSSVSGSLQATGMFVADGVVSVTSTYFAAGVFREALVLVPFAATRGLLLHRVHEVTSALVVGTFCRPLAIRLENSGFWPSVLS